HPPHERSDVPPPPARAKRCAPTKPAHERSNVPAPNPARGEANVPPPSPRTSEAMCRHQAQARAKPWANAKTSPPSHKPRHARPKAAGVTRRPQHRRRPCGRRRSAAGPWSEEPGFIPGDERGGAAPLRKTAPQTKAREPEGRGVTKRPQHRSE